MYINELGAGIQCDMITAMICRGQALGATTGAMSVSAAQNVAAVIFNPPNFGMQIPCTGSQVQMGRRAHITADPGRTRVPAILNKNRGSTNPPVAVVEYNGHVPTGPNQNVTTDMLDVSASSELQYFQELADPLLPPGTGIEVWLPLTGPGAAAVNCDWYEC